jgi:hypothetical protein
MRYALTLITLHLTPDDDVDSSDAARLSPRIRGEEDTTCTGRDSAVAPWSVEKGINSHKKWIAAQRQTASGGGRLIASHALSVQLQAR